MACHSGNVQTPINGYLRLNFREMGPCLPGQQIEGECKGVQATRQAMADKEDFCIICGLSLFV